MIFLIGPPCSGKSTILKALEEITQFKTYYFDTEIDALIQKNKLKSGEIITDKFIDQAVKIYFKKIKNISNNNLLCEITYHNYEKLLKEYPIFYLSKKISLFAPLSILLERNSKRISNKIPVLYIERCLKSTLTLQKTTNLHLINTSKMKIDQTVTKITQLIC